MKALIYFLFSFFRVTAAFDVIPVNRKLKRRMRFGDANNTIPSAQAYTTSAPVGVPGDITRQLESNVEPAMLIAISSVYAANFGIAMVYATGGISQWGGSNVQADFAGVLVREVPGISGSSADDALTSGGTPNPDQPQGLLVRGYICVQCVYGTPARGGLVYVRTVSTSNNTHVGTFDATSDSSNNVVLTVTQATWACDGKDSSNNAELRVYR
jgi:hypothetical protein